MPSIHFNNPKLHSLPEAIHIRNALRDKGQTFVLTNGCFDLIHPGHLSYLREAKSKGDVLWIALNGEKSVKELKGPTRPIMSDQERAYMLSNLEVIDGIIFFNTPRLDQEILALKPDIYVKAGDYSLETLNPQERSALQTVNAKIEFIPFLQGYSTTHLINKISQAAAANSF